MASPDRLLRPQPSAMPARSAVPSGPLRPITLATNSNSGETVELPARRANRRRLDQALRFAEVGAGALTLIFWLFWFTNGWGYDWVHTYLHRTAAPAAAQSVRP